MNGKSVLRAVALTLIGLFFLFPLFWVLLMSFMTNADILRMPPSPFFKPTLHNYLALVSGEPRHERRHAEGQLYAQPVQQHGA